ncbi:MAG TPA: ribosome silencing factor [Myxococcales bacterium]|jgi:ribosome-associated protein
MAKSKAAPRTKKATPKSKAAAPAPSPARGTALEIARLALDKKALDVVVLDVRGLASYAEYMVVMTAESEPQLGAIADYVEDQMKAQGERAIGIEGVRGGRWVLIDFGDVVAHVFYQDTRGFYDLEGLWADAPRVPVEG